VTHFEEDIDSTVTQEIKVRLFPNPTDENVYMSGALANSELTVYDMRGKIIYKQTIAEIHELNVKILSPGSYWFILRNNDEVYFKERLVKTR
jgi:hypothetical protein